MPTAVIVEAIRTPLGKRNGKLRNWHPVDLAATTLNALGERTGIDPALVDDVVFGCVMQVGEQAINVARNAVLASKLPESVPGKICWALACTPPKTMAPNAQAMHKQRAFMRQSLPRAKESQRDVI